jgi:hypothetical protein
MVNLDSNKNGVASAFNSLFSSTRTNNSRAKNLNTSYFWHIIVPLMFLIILLFVFFAVYTMPDWALDCKPDLLPIRRMVNKTPV